jgi:hypothetical protein
MELNLHWSLMEKLPKLEREGETIGEPHLGWDKTIQSLRTCGNSTMEEIGLRLVFPELEKKLRKTVCFNRPWKMKRILERRGKSLPLARQVLAGRHRWWATTTERRGGAAPVAKEKEREERRKRMNGRRESRGLGWFWGGADGT